MKKYLVVLTLLAIAACKNGPTTTNYPGGMNPSLVNNPRTANGMDTVAAARKPTMDFVDTLHDFGTIKQDEVVSYEFAFTNNGKTPLIISGAAGSCGCTVPVYPHASEASATRLVSAEEIGSMRVFTDPNSAASVLKISQLQVNGNNFQISFPTVLGKVYRIERSDTLESGSWVTVQDNIAGTGGTLLVTDVGGAAQPKRFYRLVVNP